MAASGKLSSYEDVKLSDREKQKLDSPDILAIKGLGQFKEFEVVSMFRRLIEDWYVSDFRIDAARDRHEAEYSEQLSRTGDNLSVVTKYIYDNYPERFQEIVEKMKRRVPGVECVETQETEDGFTKIVKAVDNSLVKSLYDAGDLPGALWKQGILTGE